jgi:hypothetical protein
MHEINVTDRLVSDLAFGRIRSVAFVVESDVSMTLPLYQLALATARRGWELGIEDVRYWFVTPEPEPANAELEVEGITFVGSTFADVRGGLVLLDPQDESIEVDRVVTVAHEGGGVGSRHELRADSRPPEPVRPAALAA